MSERSHGQMRPSLPRSSDLVTVPPTERERSGARDTRGRFSGGNALATGRGWKAILRRQLSASLKGEAEPLARDAWRLYRGFLADLPCDCASVRQLVAERARAAVLSARYAALAAELGFETSEGIAALELSTKLGQRCERLAVTTLDLSTKFAVEAKSRPIDAHARLADAFGRKP